MIDLAKLKEYIIEAKHATADQFEEAVECTRAGKVTVDQALVLLNVTGYAEVGECLSKICRLPYRPLLGHPPPTPAKVLLSPHCAAAWKTLPVAYDAAANVLTLAVHDTEQIAKLERIHRFLMQTHSLAFTVAAEGEIEEAVQVFMWGLKPAKPGEIRKPSDAEHGKKKVTVASSKQKLSPAAKITVSRGGPTELPYADMQRSLVAISLLVAKACSANDADKLQQIRTRVRYCRLLSSRVAIPAVQQDGIAVAAWLSALGDAPELYEDLGAAHGLSEILAPERSAPERQKVGARILSLVKAYQKLQREDPATTRDINLTRARLRTMWSSAQDQQAMLETFLQVLIDEQFLAQPSRKAGAVLIADRDEATTPLLSPPLSANGYEVHVAADPKAVDRAISRRRPDLLIIDMNLPHTNGIDLCRRIKEHAATANIPIMIVGSKDGGEPEAAQALRAGANDYVAKSASLELLVLKIRRLMAEQADESGPGVAGSLNDMGFTDMIQILSAGSKSVKIALTREDQEAEVFVENGEIVHAVTGDKQSESAFYELMQWFEGKFTTAECTKFPTRTIYVPTMGLLMEEARLADEAAAAEAEGTSE